MELLVNFQRFPKTKTFSHLHTFKKKKSHFNANWPITELETAITWWSESEKGTPDPWQITFVVLTDVCNSKSWLLANMRVELKNLLPFPPRVWKNECFMVTSTCHIPRIKIPIFWKMRTTRSPFTDFCLFHRINIFVK